MGFSLRDQKRKIKINLSSSNNETTRWYPSKQKRHIMKRRDSEITWSTEKKKRRNINHEQISLTY